MSVPAINAGPSPVSAGVTGAGARAPLKQRFKAAFRLKENFSSIFMRECGGYEAMDGFRAITVIILVLFHCLFGLVRILDTGETLKLIDNIPPVFNWAWQARGSDCLFLMCGFLLAMILLREFNKSGTVDIARFYCRRGLRILPLFLVALFLYLMADFDRNLRYLWSNLLFITNLVPGQKNIIPVGWSLVLQIQFYAIVPFLVLWLARSRRKLFFLSFFFVLAAAVNALVLLSHPNLFEIPMSTMIMGREKQTAREFASLVYYPFHTRMGPFFIGMLLAVVNAEYGDRIRRSFHKRPLLETATVAAGLVLLWLATSVPMHDPAAPFNGSEFNPWANFLYLSTHRSVLTLGVTLLLIAAFHGAFAGRWVNRFFSARIWYPFAQLIYPIYLFHFPFIVVAAVIVFRTTDRSTIHDVGMPEVFGIFAIALLLTFLFSILVHLFIERPAINIRG